MGCHTVTSIFVSRVVHGLSPSHPIVTSSTRPSDRHSLNIADVAPHSLAYWHVACLRFSWRCHLWGPFWHVRAWSAFGSLGIPHLMLSFFDIWWHVGGGAPVSSAGTYIWGTPNLIAHMMLSCSWVSISPGYPGLASIHVPAPVPPACWSRSWVSMSPLSYKIVAALSSSNVVSSF